MNIDDLRRKVNVEGELRDRPTREQLREFQNARGKRPREWEDYLAVFGSGWLLDYFYIYNLHSWRDESSLEEWEEEVTAFLKDLRDNSSEIAIWPEDQGYLPFYLTLGGAIGYWRTSEDPEKWTVSVGDWPEIEDTNKGFCEFFEGLASGELVLGGLPEKFFVDKWVFRTF
jgi:hypothetical protein